MSDGTAIDPVCGKQVDTLRARAVGIFGGVTFYFCSAECKARYVDPRKEPREPEPEEIPRRGGKRRAAPRDKPAAPTSSPIASSPASSGAAPVASLQAASAARAEAGGGPRAPEGDAGVAPRRRARTEGSASGSDASAGSSAGVADGEPAGTGRGPWVVALLLVAAGGVAALVLTRGGAGPEGAGASAPAGSTGEQVGSAGTQGAQAGTAGSTTEQVGSARQDQAGAPGEKLGASPAAATAKGSPDRGPRAGSGSSRSATLTPPLMVGLRRFLSRRGDRATLRLRLLLLDAAGESADVEVGRREVASEALSDEVSGGSVSPNQEAVAASTKPVVLYEDALVLGTQRHLTRISRRGDALVVEERSLPVGEDGDGVKGSRSAPWRAGVTVPLPPGAAVRAAALSRKRYAPIESERAKSDKPAPAAEPPPSSGERPSSASPSRRASGKPAAAAQPAAAEPAAAQPTAAPPAPAEPTAAPPEPVRRGSAKRPPAADPTSPEPAAVEPE